MNLKSNLLILVLLPHKPKKLSFVIMVSTRMNRIVHNAFDNAFKTIVNNKVVLFNGILSATKVLMKGYPIKLWFQ